MSKRDTRFCWVHFLPAVALAALLLAPAPADAQSAPKGGWAADAPVLSELVTFAREQSDLRITVERYNEDRAAILRRYEVDYSPVRRDRIRRFYQDWQKRLAELDFDRLNHEGQIDYTLLRNRLAYELDMLRVEDGRWKEMASLVPFADRLRLLQEDRHDRKRVEPRAAAETVDQVAAEVERLTSSLSADARGNAPVSRPGITPVVAFRAASYLGHLREVVADWNRFYSEYDPMFTWWATKPYERLDKALVAYTDTIRRHLVGIRPGEPEPLIGEPVFEEGLRAHLAVEMIPYTVQELIDIGWRELEWTEQRFREVSRDMGFGDNWKAALEHVKNLAPPPGEKPWAIFDIAKYSEDFVEKMDAITVPPLAYEVWRLAMMTPAQQLINPFFGGGEVTRVSYPTIGMTHEAKVMSMRGNTPHFNFATVHHELIPGHHMQGFMTRRFNSHRGPSVFWGEGWALYWELLLWDANFPRGNEDKMGMLFWRAHRAARIVFSLSFHLGKMTAQEAVDFLVDRVGHERANAEGEVRRSLRAVPLYQAAYLLGGLQMREMKRELVDSGRMTLREFHDQIMQGGRMPVEMVRARLAKQPLTKDFRTTWRFYPVKGTEESPGQ
jgi:uncharacterized protein (DUF885 family)